MVATRWIEDNQSPLTPLESAWVGQRKIDANDGTQAGLLNRMPEQNWAKNLSPEEKKTHELEKKLHNLMEHQDVGQLNQMLRDTSLKSLISDQLKNEILGKLKEISMDKVHGYVRDGNIGGVTEEMAGRLNDVKVSYKDIWARLAEELNKPEIVGEDRTTIQDLQNEVEEAQTMVDDLLNNVNALARSPKKIQDMPPETDNTTAYESPTNT